MRRLAFGLPTAVQINPDRALLLYGGGVKKFLLPNDGPAYNPLRPEPANKSIGRIWALVDSNKQLLEPAGLFQVGPFFVVEASSPRPIRRDWMKKVKTSTFYMKQWSFCKRESAHPLEPTTLTILQSLGNN